MTSVPGVLQVTVDATVESVLDRSSEDWLFYQQSKVLFGNDEIIVAVVDLASVPLGEVRDLGVRLAGLRGVDRVDSIFSFPAIRTGESGELRLDPLDESEAAEGGLDWLRKADRLAPGLLVSRDGLHTAVNIRLNAGIEGGLEDVVLDIRRACAGLCRAVSGVPVFRDETNRRIQLQLVKLAPTAALLLLAVLALFLGSPTGAACSVAPGVIAALGAGGLMGYLGIELTISTLVLPTILVGLGTAYSIHFAVAQVDAIHGVEAALRPIGAPVALSGATTAIGLAAIATVPIEAVRQLAWLGVVGSGTATVCSLTFVPAACALRGGTWSKARWLGSLASCVVGLGRLGATRPVLAAVVALAVLVPAAAGISRVEINTDVVRWFPKDDWVRRDFDAVRNSLAGITAVNVVLESQVPDGIVDPAAINELNAFGNYLRGEAEVGWVGSVADPILQLHRELEHGSIRLTTGAIEQYLLLLDSEPRFDDLLSPDRRIANVPILLSENDSGAVMRLAEKARRWWAPRGEAGLGVRVTGVMYEFARAEERIAWGQLQGLGLAVLVIAWVLAIASGSLSLGLAALVPNVGPVLVGVGLMGWMGAAIDAGTVVIGTLALGLAVDDTIHLVAAHQRCDSTLRGWKRAETVVGGPGPALALTTIVLCAAFAALAFSSFAFVRNLGVFTSVILLMCLFADVLLLPRLLEAVSRRAAGLPIPPG